VHQILVQYQTVNDQCPYYGDNGAGYLIHMNALVLTATALLAVIILLTPLRALFIISLHQFRSLNVYKIAMECVVDETTRLRYCSAWMNRSLESLSSSLQGQTSPLGETYVMLGERKGQVDSDVGKLWIGPASETLYMRNGRIYQPFLGGQPTHDKQ
jgi:hypothetical protein